MKNINGPLQNICKVDSQNDYFETLINQGKAIERHMEIQNERAEENDKWVRDKMMPIKTHLIILISALSVITGFTVLKAYLEKLLG